MRCFPRYEALLAPISPKPQPASLQALPFLNPAFGDAPLSTTSTGSRPCPAATRSPLLQKGLSNTKAQETPWPRSELPGGCFPPPRSSHRSRRGAVVLLAWGRGWWQQSRGPVPPPGGGGELVTREVNNRKAGIRLRLARESWVPVSSQHVTLMPS